MVKNSKKAKKSKNKKKENIKIYGIEDTLYPRRRVIATKDFGDDTTFTLVEYQGMEKLGDHTTLVEGFTSSTFSYLVGNFLIKHLNLELIGKITSPMFSVKNIVTKFKPSPVLGIYGNKDIVVVKCLVELSKEQYRVYYWIAQIILDLCMRRGIQNVLTMETIQIEGNEDFFGDEESKEKVKYVNAEGEELDPETIQAIEKLEEMDEEMSSDCESDDDGYIVVENIEQHKKKKKAEKKKAKKDLKEKNADKDADKDLKEKNAEKDADKDAKEKDAEKDTDDAEDAEDEEKKESSKDEEKLNHKQSRKDKMFFITTSIQNAKFLIQESIDAMPIRDASLTGLSANLFNHIDHFPGVDLTCMLLPFSSKKPKIKFAVEIVQLLDSLYPEIKIDTSCLEKTIRHIEGKAHKILQLAEQQQQKQLDPGPAHAMYM